MCPSRRPASHRRSGVLGAVAALALVVVGAQPAGAAVVAGALDCVAPAQVDVEGGRLVADWDGVQKDRNNYTTAEKLAMEQDFQAAKEALGFDLDLADIKDPIEIDVYFHVVRKNGTIDGGNIPVRGFARR